MGFWLQVRNLILLESGRFEGIRELPWDLPGCLIGTDVVPILKRKELLDINNSSWTPRISPDWLKLSPGRQCLAPQMSGPALPVGDREVWASRAVDLVRGDDMRERGWQYTAVLGVLDSSRPQKFDSGLSLPKFITAIETNLF
ncbi:hypothetical protein F2Q70_00014744 [Brassica cretica]|uniref:Uncharacterized protein n=1 Tax=Brassica cretica TaxID=69181 RepID=A0A8S9KU57_BRACR|nr:hypothetical protein F2Q70_00014744 [Brassica cretica]KAF2598534.1 hypothetical protein F2Q68_00007836 [Brassica cretica]